jgi:hypothetical protein
VQSKDAGLEFSAHATGVGAAGQNEPADKTAIGAFDAMIAPGLLFLVEPALAPDGYYAVSDGDSQVPLPDIRQFSPDKELFVGFTDVHDRGPGNEGARCPLAIGSGHSDASRGRGKFELYFGLILGRVPVRD